MQLCVHTIVGYKCLVSTPRFYLTAMETFYLSVDCRDMGMRLQVQQACSFMALYGYRVKTGIPPIQNFHMCLIVSTTLFPEKEPCHMVSHCHFARYLETDHLDDFRDGK